MSDADTLLGVLTAAGDPTRLQILRHAAGHGVVRTRDAKAILRGSPRSGTVSYHLSALTSARLLSRAGRGEYRLTPAGVLIIQLGVALARVIDGGRDNRERREGQVVIRVSDTSGQIEELLPLEGELVAEVRRTRPAGVVDEERLHLLRLE